MPEQYIQVNFVPQDGKARNAKQSRGTLFIGDRQYACVSYNRKYTRIFLPLPGADKEFKFKFYINTIGKGDIDPITLSLSELEQDHVAGQLTNEEYKTYREYIYILNDGKDGEYGTRQKYKPGKDLGYWVNNVFGRSVNKVDAWDEILYLFRNVLRSYQRIKAIPKKGSLPLDFSLGNVLSEGGDGSACNWSWVPMDNGDYIDNSNVVRGDERVRTRQDTSVERLLSSRQKYNHVFFFAFHDFLRDSLMRVLKETKQQEQKEVVDNVKVRELQETLLKLGSFNPDVIPKSDHHSSSGDLFVYYDKLLNSLLYVADAQETENHTSKVQAAAWKQLVRMKKQLVPIINRLNERGANDLVTRIVAFANKINNDGMPSILEARILHKEGTDLFMDLYKDSRIKEHRNNKEHRKGGEKPFFSSIHPALRVFIGLTLLGALVLLGLYIAQQAPTYTETVVKKQVSQSVYMLSRMAKEGRKASSSVASKSSVLTGIKSKRGGGEEKVSENKRTRTL